LPTSRAAVIASMTTTIVEIYEALRSAGAPEDNAQAAATALARHEQRFDRVDGKLAALEAQVTMVKWITSATFAGVLALIIRAFL
jgi:hypothetical protein